MPNPVTTTAIQRVEPHHEMPLMQMGEVFSASGYFADARDAAQAVVKIQAGRELGFGPVASLTNIFMVKNRITMSAAIMSAAIKRSTKYDYKVGEHTEKVCNIDFFENGKLAGSSKYTWEMATAAGLVKGDNWKAHPKNMLFARAMSNGAKWYCPDVFCGGVYTPEEMGVPTDGVTDQPSAAAYVEGQLLPAKSVETKPEPARTRAVEFYGTAPAADAPAADKALAEVGEQLTPPVKVDFTKLDDLIETYQIPHEKQAAWCAHFKVQNLDQLNQEQVDGIIERVEKTVQGE